MMLKECLDFSIGVETFTINRTSLKKQFLYKTTFRKKITFVVSVGIRMCL